MTRIGALIGLIVLTAAAGAQIPDVQVKADLGPSYRNEVEGGSSVRWYDPFGRHSVIALQFALEPGFRAYVAQKIQRIPNDGDPSQIDESYVEDMGVWRAGKQYLPFGSQSVLRESVLAIRSDTELFLRTLPTSVAACDGGTGRQRGIVGRIGTRLGISFAYGRHFGISGTSLTQVRLPEESPGIGGGYRQAFGADYSRRHGVVVFRGEYVLLREAEQDEPDRSVLDLSVSLEPSLRRSLTLGYSVATEPSLHSLRLQGRFEAAPSVWIEPWIRTRGEKVFDTGVTVRMRL